MKNSLLKNIWITSYNGLIYNIVRERERKIFQKKDLLKYEKELDLS